MVPLKSTENLQNRKEYKYPSNLDVKSREIVLVCLSNKKVFEIRACSQMSNFLLYLVFIYVNISEIIFVRE